MVHPAAHTKRCIALQLWQRQRVHAPFPAINRSSTSARAANPAAMATACVTGATGFIAHELIFQLLEKGYHVRATCRCPIDSPNLASLHKLNSQHAGRLDLVQVESILEPSPALQGAINGSQYLFHVASPFRFDGDPQRDIVDPAVEGTRTVMKAAAAATPPLKRVIVTSSVCAIHDKDQAQAPKGPLYTEEDWNTVSQLPEQAYWVSKVEAEKVAWEVAREAALDLVTILPNFVLGPFFIAGNQLPSGISVGFMKGILATPRDGTFKGTWTICDVRDVAEAHIVAAESAGAAGRYIVSLPGSINARAITDAIKAGFKRVGAGALPDGEEDATKVTIDNSKVVALLGRPLREPAATVHDMVDSFVDGALQKGTWAPEWLLAESNAEQVVAA